MDRSPRSAGPARGQAGPAGAAAASAPSPVWISLGLGVLLHLRQVAYLAELDNRYKSHWQRQDALALGIDIALTALAIWALLALLGRARRAALRHLRAPLQVWLAAAAGLSLLSLLDLPDGVLAAGSAAPALLAAASWFAAPERVQRVFARAGPILASVAVATFLQLAWWAPWGSEPESLAVRGAPRPGAVPASVYVFVFDEWSFDRSTEAGALRPLLPELRAVASQSFVFQRAAAPDWDTARSLPHLLFARDGSWSFLADERGTWWKSAAGVVPSRESDSLFTPFARAGYRTALIGFYLPYRRIVNDDVQVVRSHPHVPRGDSLLERMQVRGLDGSRLLVGSALASRFQESYASRYSRHWFEIGESTLADVLQVIRSWPDPTLLFAHWPVPHPPFVFEADGSYRGAFQEERIGGSDADYDRALRNLDRIAGLLVRALRERGRFDGSLLVFTSDHGWKKHDRTVRHVPLIVKWPHQERAQGVERPFRTIDLPGLLEQVLSAESDVEGARRAIEARLLEPDAWPGLAH